MASSDLVRVLGACTSPFVVRVIIALNIKCVEHELVEENILDSKSDLLLKLNPVYQKVPVLIHGDKPISESRIIVEYIDEVWASGPAILPSDPYDRAMARFWSAYIDDKLTPALKAIVTARVEAKKAAAVEEATHALALLEDAFIKCCKGCHKFFGGDNIGHVDISLGCHMAWLRVIKKLANVSLINEMKTPNLYRWAQDFSADDAAKDVLPETDKILEFAKTLVAVKAFKKN